MPSFPEIPVPAFSQQVINNLYSVVSKIIMVALTSKYSLSFLEYGRSQGF